ncbi:MAG: hypothetical protein ACERKV_01670 [Clostridiaceae bacterium]
MSGIKDIVENKLVSIFETVGAYINSDDFDEIIQLDSLQFVSVILEIEETFMIRISADYYSYDELKTFNDYVKLIVRFLD